MGSGVVTAPASRCRRSRGCRRHPGRTAAQPLASLLDVRALLRLVEVTSERIDAAKRNGAGQGHGRCCRPPVPCRRAGSASTTRRSSRSTSWPVIRSRPPSCASCIEGSGFVVDRWRTGRARRGSAGVPLGGYDVPVGVPLAADDRAIDGFRAVLANLRDAMVANWDGTVADIDPEFLHDLRVAVRRTRVVLANAKRVLPDDVRQQAREDFAWLGAISGTARDLDVYQIEWPDYTAALDATATEALVPLREHLGVERQAAHVELAAQLSSARASEVVESWNGWLDHPVDVGTLGDRSDEALAKTVAAAGPPRPPGDGRPRADDHAGDARRDGARAAQGRQEAALPHRVLRRAVRQGRRARRSSAG